MDRFRDRESKCVSVLSLSADHPFAAPLVFFSRDSCRRVFALERVTVAVLAVVDRPSHPIPSPTACIPAFGFVVSSAGGVFEDGSPPTGPSVR